MASAKNVYSAELEKGKEFPLMYNLRAEANRAKFYLSTCYHLTYGRGFRWLLKNNMAEK